MIADALRFLGAEVYYFSRTRKPDAEAAGIAYLPLRELLPEVDILCTCLPRNTILLGADEFRLFGNLEDIDQYVGRAYFPCPGFTTLA